MNFRFAVLLYIGACVASRADAHLEFTVSGTLIAWGNDYYGLVSSMPRDLTNVVKVSVGSGAAAALRDDGTVAVWGFGGNPFSRLGSVLTDVIDIDAGNKQVLALRASGEVVCLDLMNYAYNPPPDNLGEAVSVMTWDHYNRAMLRDGTVAAWKKIRMSKPSRISTM